MIPLPLLLLSPVAGSLPVDRPKVVATLPTVAALVREVAGDAVDVLALGRGDEDPHFVPATPLLMRRARDARALFEVGMRLEIWADHVASGSGNPAIQRGTPGRVVLSDGLSPLEVPTRIDAAAGDIHPQGNPHLWLDPVRAKQMARNAATALERLIPDSAPGFRERLADFEARLDRALYGEELLRLVGARTLDNRVLSGTLHEFLDREHGGAPLRERAGGWLARARPLRGAKAIEYHKVWAYFAQAFGLELRGVIEEYPGVRPGPGHVQRTIESLRRESIPLVLVDNFYERDLPGHVAKEGGARIVVLPNQVEGEEGVRTYFDLVDTILGRLLAALP